MVSNLFFLHSFARPSYVHKMMKKRGKVDTGTVVSLGKILNPRPSLMDALLYVWVHVSACP